MERPKPQDNDHELAIMPVPPSNPAMLSETLPEAEAANGEYTPTSLSRSKQITSLFALFSTLFIAALNATVVATAIPTICRELDSADGYAWIGAAYLLGTTASSPMWAKFSDIWGRKAILLCAVIGFFFSSIICALSVNMTMLIAGRAFQGIAGGGLIQLVTIVMSDRFSMRHRSLYIGLLEIIWCIAGGIGPVLGGAFSQHISWRWIFWIALPPCAIAFVLLIFALDVHNPRTGMIEGMKAVDWAGSASILALLIMFLLGLNFGGVDYPWNSPTVICLIAFGAFMSIFFVFSEKKLARYPLIPLGLFGQWSNVVALFVGFAQHFALYSGDYYLPFFFQSAKALSPVAAGTLIIPLVLSEAFTGFVAGWYIHFTGRYVELMWLGQILLAAGYGSFIHWDANTGVAEMSGTQILAGIGTGMLFTPPLIALQARVPQKDTATATATFGLFKNVATVLAVVTGQTTFQNGMDMHKVELLSAGLDSNFRAAFEGDRAAASLGLIGELPDVNQRLAVQQAFAESLKGIWILDACLVAVGLLCSPLLVKSKLSKEHVETKTGLEAEKSADTS